MAAPPDDKIIGANSTLPKANYDLVEIIFRDYMLRDTNYVFQILYGKDGSPLPAEFLARFKDRLPIVRGNRDAVIVVSNKFFLDKITGKQLIELDITKLRVTNDTAEAQVRYCATSVDTSTRFFLVRKQNKWVITEEENEWVMDGF
jgi:hypothetical protein